MGCTARAHAVKGIANFFTNPINLFMAFHVIRHRTKTQPLFFRWLCRYLAMQAVQTGFFVRLFQFTLPRQNI
jgi:hypothetical protein